MAIDSSQGQNRDLILAALEQLAEHGLPPKEATGIFDVGTGAFLDYFVSEVLEGIVAPGGSTCRFFEGPYGSGKTHLMQLIQTAALDRNFVTVRVDLSQHLSFRHWGSIVKTILQTMTIETETGSIVGLPAILNFLADSHVLTLDRLESSNLPHPGFRTAMLAAIRPRDLNSRGYELLSSFLSGDGVGVKRLREAGIPGVKHPLSERNSEQVLQTVLGGLHSLGLPGTVIIFDENERSFDRYRGLPGWVITSANKLRRLIDACFTENLIGTAMIFATLPGFLERCQLAYPALGQRIRIYRGGAFNSSWRWPVLSVGEISAVDSPEHFLEEEAEIMNRLVTDISGQAGQIKKQLLDQGTRVLNGNAGSGYRRELMKSLAASTLFKLRETI